MGFLFDTFDNWHKYCQDNSVSLAESVVQYEIEQKSSNHESIMVGMRNAYAVMKEAVQTGLSEEMNSRSGMIKNGAKRVYNHKIAVLSPEFQKLILRTLSTQVS